MPIFLHADMIEIDNAIFFFQISESRSTPSFIVSHVSDNQRGLLFYEVALDYLDKIYLRSRLNFLRSEITRPDTGALPLIMVSGTAKRVSNCCLPAYCSDLGSCMYIRRASFAYP